jgi:putative transposase
VQVEAVKKLAMVHGVVAPEWGQSRDGSSFPALDQLVSIYGGPEALRMENGPELISEALMAWCGERDIAMHHIQPGKPDQNAHIERFNRSYREEVPDAHLFGSIEEAQAISDE